MIAKKVDNFISLGESDEYVFATVDARYMSIFGFKVETIRIFKGKTAFSSWKSMDPGWEFYESDLDAAEERAKARESLKGIIK